jgi:Uma2 family endonuclease
VDAPLVAPESGYEIIDGQVIEVPPAQEPHADRNSKLAALLEAHVGDDFNVALHMLTRTSALDDFAPDASVYPVARDEETGGRQLEHLAFEVVSTETMGHSAVKAAKLLARGVRRVFALDVENRRVLEWSAQTEAWRRIADGSVLEDPCFAVALPVDALTSAAKVEDAVAAALIAKGNPVFLAALREIEDRAQATEGARGIAIGHSTALRDSLEIVCASLGIALDADRRATMRTADLDALQSLIDTILRTRDWPR